MLRPGSAHALQGNVLAAQLGHTWAWAWLFFLPSLEGAERRQRHRKGKVRHLEPGQETGDRSSKAPSSCGKSCVVGRRAFQRVKGAGAAGFGDLCNLILSQSP